MRKAIRILIICTLVLAAVCGCADKSGEEEKAFSVLRQSYRGAQLVATGFCTRIHTDAQGQPCAVLRISEVIAGRAKAGAEVHCSTDALKQDGAYLFYLTPGEAPYAADECNYSLVNAVSWDAESNAAVLENARIPMASLREDAANLNAVISAPSSIWFYHELSGLATAADEIFIGRVRAIPPLADTAFREKSDSATVEHSLPAAVASIEVYGRIKGTLRYGERISLVEAPGLCADLVDAATLTSVSYGEQDTPALTEGCDYIFFLLQGPDEKQSYYFGVNPVQGYAQLTADALTVVAGNEAISAYETLPALLLDLRAAL